MRTTRYRQYGCTIYEHRFDMPADHTRPNDGNTTIEVFVREVVRDGGENLPYLLYLQGGPGYGAPRPGNFHDGWLGHLLKDYRLVLLDQRGTGQSTRLDARRLVNDPRFCTTSGTLDAPALAAYLMLFRQDQIVRDAEVVREALTGGKMWTTLGQSFGGFITTTYLSLAPHAIEKSYITGGLPGMVHIDDIYRRTYQATAARNEAYLRRHSNDAQVIREIAAHLQDVEEYLPSGERLSTQRFRMLGLGLGTQTRTDLLHYLLEGPWVQVKGTRRLSEQFLEDIAAELAITPMYAVLHETIYAGATPALAGTATAWSADRLAEEVPGFAKDANPLDMSEPYYLTGEHMMRSLFTESPALRPFAQVVDILATRTDWNAVYLPEVLSDLDVPVAAAVYYDDMFVPRELSMDTAALMKNVRTWVTSEYQHDGLRASGSQVVEHLQSLLNE
ncbi:alpha/beta fold hydrolase [Schaalia suimastitidis]|uniref:alpha/beta fold hydrolase n=1 Tax=Schaalia suimastitidis TaxID=121163 RepID=UPI0003F9C78D|nr:alpha/beta fold hydrolase [Schaalia suimastitidis]